MVQVRTSPPAASFSGRNGIYNCLHRRDAARSRVRAKAATERMSKDREAIIVTETARTRSTRLA